MNRSLHVLLIAIALTCCFRTGMAQSVDPKKKPSLNNIRIGHCTSNETFSPTAASDIEKEILDEQKRGLVMDARPFAINQSTGKLLFAMSDARVSVVHMNPFVYDYKISVAQQELVSTALSDFLKLLLPPNLATAVGTQSGRANEKVGAAAINGLTGLERRLGTFKRPSQPCADNDRPCAAITEMFKIFDSIKEKVAEKSDLREKLDNSVISRAGTKINTNDEYVAFAASLTSLRNQQFSAYETCNSAQKLNGNLNYDFKGLFSDLNTAQQQISEIKELADDLLSLTTAFNGDDALKGAAFHCSGFNCIAQLKAYADEVKEVIGTQGYEKKLADLRQKGKEMQNMYQFTEQLKNKEGMFARTFTIAKKFELSQATISIKRDRIESKDTANSGGTQSGNATPSAPIPAGGGGGIGSGGIGAGGSEGSIGGSEVPGQVQAGTPETPQKSGAGSGDKPAGATALVADVNEVVHLGRPRFMLSGGMVYSPLPRRTFKPVKGFVLDAQGNPTGNGDANIIGFDQNSPRRLLPMMFLNSRLLDYEKGSLFFSLGISAKHDDNIDIEYLVGPSVSFLNDRALFTFGAYGGLTQNLVSDVKLGDAIPDSLGNAKFFRKSLTWKPGFSFSYAFSRAKKVEVKSTGNSSSTPADELKNEIRIGGIPFNLALGLAVTSLEQRTYDEIAGFARDRQGNLTNGQTLTRIVGLTSSSGYRMTPMVMLHSRLTRFDGYDFYFTSGLTGKKTDSDFDLEYLLGGSVNIFQRKVFLTFGTYIGKQQILGGNFFEGAALGKTQDVTTINRYVWKPAISFSYDISRIIPRSN